VNYYKRHIGDYAAATRHLSMIEHGAYSLLLDVYYTSELPLPADPKEAARKAGARGKEETAAVESILREFFTLEADGWHQKRCDKEIAERRAAADKHREVGKRGGRPRQFGGNGPRGTKPNRLDEENQNGFVEEPKQETEMDSANLDLQNPSHKPLTISQEKDDSPIGELSPAAPDDADEPEPSGVPPCPVKRIIALYHEVLPELPAVRAFPDAAERMLRSRWREEPNRQTLDWWSEFFVYVRDRCPFLVGKRTDFTADLMWLVRPTNFAKVLNGNYEQRDAA